MKNSNLMMEDFMDIEETSQPKTQRIEIANPIPTSPENPGDFFDQNLNQIMANDFQRSNSTIVRKNEFDKNLDLL